MPDGTPPAEGLLAVLVDAVLRIEAGQREILAALRRPADARLGGLLVATFDVLGDSDFTAALLFELALDNVPGRADLRASLLAIVGPKPKGAVRRLGRFLAVHADAEVDGLRLVRLTDRGRDGATYRVVDVIAERD